VAFWLLKSEPDVYSYADLVRDGDAEWDGVTANPAQFQMRQMALGDRCVIYHTGNERRAIGLAEVVKPPYPDPTDPAGKRVWVDLRAVQQLARPVTLAELKTRPVYEGSPLLRMSRLSVVPLTEPQWEALLELAAQH
jgi:predicted RNA-binding protein with PUA-like domain